MDLEEDVEDGASVRSGSSHEEATDSDSEDEDDSASTNQLETLLADFSRGNASGRRSIIEALLDQDVPAAREIPPSVSCFSGG